MHLHCSVPTPLLDHPYRRLGQIEETPTRSVAPLDTFHQLVQLPSLTTFRIDSGACDAWTTIFMPSENVSRHSPSYSWLRRPHSVNWSKKFFAFREAQPGCMIPMSIAVCRPAASGWYSVLICFQAAILCASDKSQRFPTDRAHQEIVQLFHTEPHLRSELCKRFIRQPCERTFQRGIQIGHGCHRLEDERPFSPLRVATGESWTLVHHARVHLPCYRGSCSLGFCCQSLSFSEMLTHFRQCLGQLLHRCHVRSARQVLKRTDRRHSALNGAPLPCCNVWITSAFLIHHKKAVRTRCHKVFLTLQGWTDQETTYKQDVCKKSGSSPHKSQQVVYRGSEHVQRQRVLNFPIVAVAKHGPRNQTWTPLSLLRDRPRSSTHMCRFCSVRKLGCVQDRQPTIILQVSFLVR